MPLCALIVMLLVGFAPAAAAADGSNTRCVRDGCHDAPADLASHEPYRTGRCPVCHEPGPGFRDESHDRQAFSASSPPSGSCRACHEELAARVASSPGHGGGESAPCGSCHVPHESPFPFLLRGPYPAASYAPFSLEIYGICWQCHDTTLAADKMTTATGFRQGRRNFHYSHLHKRTGMTCRICHEPHDGGRPFLLRGTLARDDGGWRGEMRFLPAAAGGSCVGGCHKHLSYTR